jgi:mediator of RNA polymerase II transcription subunit 23
VDLIKEHPGPKDNGAQLKKSVEEEWRNWNSVNNENDMIAHFSNSQVRPCPQE